LCGLQIKLIEKDALVGIAFWIDARASQLASVLDGFNRNRTPQHTKTRRKLRSIVDNTTDIIYSWMNNRSSLFLGTGFVELALTLQDQK